MVEEKITKLVRCDICNGVIQDSKVDIITFRGEFSWDLCHICQRNLELSLTFLTRKAGLSIDYSWSKKDYELLAR